MSAAGRVAALVEAQAHDLLRRRTALLLLVALPMAFYAALEGNGPHSVATGTVASAFSVAGAAIFLTLAAGKVDRRLVLAGCRPAELLVARLMVVVGLGVPIAVVSATIMTLVTQPSRPAELFLAVALVAATAATFGLAIGCIITRELEATLVLIGVVGVQLAAEPMSLVSRLLPFGQPRITALASVGAAPHASSPLLSLLYGVSMLLTAALISQWRLRTIRRRTMGSLEGPSSLVGG